jgi:integrase
MIILVVKKGSATMPKQRANGEGSITRLPNGKFKATVTVEVIRDAKNKVIKQTRKTFTHEKRKECQIWLNERLNEKNKDILVSPDKITVEEWLGYWLDKYKKPNIKSTTYENYKIIIDTHLIPTIGKIKLQSLQTTDLQSLYAKKIKDGKSPRIVEYIHTLIHGALKQALKENKIPKNVSEFCEIPKVERKEMLTLSAEEIKQLLSANKEHRLYALLMLELGTGLRRSELLALHWRHIDLDKGLLSVEGSLGVTKEQGVFYQTPKTKSSVRTFPLPQSAIDELKCYREKQLAYIASHKDYQDKDIVFPRENGDYIRPSTLTQIFKYTWLKNAGLSQRSFHSLRHTHATQMLAMNIHTKVIQERLGHSRSSTTLDIYAHANQQMQQDASDKIDDLLNNL